MRNKKRLWAALSKRVIDFVVSDHSPSPPAMKCSSIRVTFSKPGAGSALCNWVFQQCGRNARGRNHSFHELARWLSGGPAQLAGLEKHKGAIAVGYDADMVVWNSEKRFVVNGKMLHHRHKLTPYLNQRLRGVVEATFS